MMCPLKAWTIITRTQDGDMFASDRLYETENEAKRHESGMVIDSTLWRKVQRVDIDLFNVFHREDPQAWTETVYIAIMYDTRFSGTSFGANPFHCDQRAYPSKEIAMENLEHDMRRLESQGFEHIYDKYTVNGTKVKLQHKNDKNLLWEVFLVPVRIPDVNGLKWKD